MRCPECGHVFLNYDNRYEPREDGTGYEDLILMCPDCGADLKRVEPDRCGECGEFVPSEKYDPCPECDPDRYDDRNRVIDQPDDELRG